MQKGDGIFTVIVWELPPNAEQLKKEFFDKIKVPFIGKATKAAMKAEYLLSEGLQVIIDDRRYLRERR